jgi:hypothetical protein
LAGGISGLGEDVAAANMLTYGYNYAPTGAAFNQTMREVGGATRGLNMATTTAAQAIGGLQTGSMGGNLYQYGVHTIDPKTGQQLSTENIARQMYNRIFQNQKGLTYKDVQGSLQYGMAGANLRNMGLSDAQQQLFSTAFLNFSQGKSFDLANMTSKGNPQSPQYQQITSQTDLMQRATDPMIVGFQNAADTVTKLNTAMAGLPDSFFQLKAAIQGVANTSAGAGIAGAIAGVGAGVGTAVAASGLRKLLGVGAGTAAKTGSQVVQAGAGMALKKVVPVIGGVIAEKTGSSFMSTITTGAIAGGAIAGIASGGAAALPGAAVGALTAGAGWLIGKATDAMTSKSTKLSAAPDQTQWATAFLGKVGAPVTASNLQAMTTWMAREGGNWNNNATYNPLNTTQNMKGATSMNSVGVKAYASWDQGLQATVNTINNGKYSPVLNALRQGTSAAAVLSAVQDSPWSGSSHYGGTLASGASSSSTGQTVNISLTIDKASDAEAIVFAKKVKQILQNDKSLSTIGSK